MQAEPGPQNMDLVCETRHLMEFITSHIRRSCSHRVHCSLFQRENLGNREQMELSVHRHIHHPSEVVLLDLLHFGDQGNLDPIFM